MLFKRFVIKWHNTLLKYNKKKPKQQQQQTNV